MLFNSLSFLIFIFVFFLLYFLMRGKLRLWISLISSYFFYGWWDYRFLVLIIIITLLNFYCGLNISTQANKKKNRLLLLISIISNLFILFIFKYYNFFTDNFISILSILGYENNFNTLKIILPIGISFYTFQAMSYTIDVYRKNIDPEKSLLNFATFVAFFPQLVAGPIVRASCLIPQLKKDRSIVTENILYGIHLIIWGYFLKIVIADSLSLVVDVCYNNPISLNPFSIFIGVIFYAFQIYGDFAGYSLIAIGISRVLGYKFPVNFNRPYFSRSISEFWQKWHISLSTWLRDYEYISLGGNRAAKLKMDRYLFITMVIGGLWHGANWNFVIWGTIHGSLLIIDRLSMELIGKRLKFDSHNIILKNIIKIGNILFTFSLTCLAWIFFRSNNFSDSIYIIEKLFQFNEYNFSDVIHKFHVTKGIILISFLIITESISFNFDMIKFNKNHPYYSLLWSASILVLISLFGTFGNSAFIYFQF